MLLITQQKSLETFCADLARCPFIAVDTEFMREKTYWPILCLIQAAGADPDGTAIEGMIDPLAEGLDLAPFHALLADPAIVKVFHAARQDVEIFYNLTQTVPAPLFDSQVAAMACGFGDQIGYEPLMRELLGAQIDKGSRFTDWSRRPLTEAQLKYALSDVTHLREAYPKLVDKLTKDGRDHWVREEMEALLDPQLYFIEPEQAWQRLKLRNIRPKELGPLVKLAEWREREAQHRNVPRSRILKDDGLYEVARLRPTSREDLSKARSIPKGFERSDAGSAILAAIAEGKAAPMDSLPTIERNERKAPPPADVLDLLRVLLKTQCESYGVAPKLIATASDLEAIARITPKQIDEDRLPKLPALQGWRHDVFGQHALALKQGRLALRLHKGRVQIIPHEEQA
ncbi:MAG: ribonuclease D [Pseudomonadota bacterium]